MGALSIIFWVVRILIYIPEIIQTIREILQLIEAIRGTRKVEVKTDFKELLKKHVKAKCKDKEASKAEIKDFKKTVEQVVVSQMT